MSYAHENSKGTEYFLNTQTVTLKGGRQQVIYFFSRDEREATGCDMPSGYVVVENARTGLPILKKG